MVDKLCFIKANSRLGMKYIPKGGTVLNLGVENGPSSILNDSFLKKIIKRNNFDIIDYTFSKPEDVKDKEYYHIVAKETNTLAKLIFNKIKKNNYKYLITLGGDHSVSLASILAVLKLYKTNEVGFICFDSHGDIHLTKTSPTGNFHGMWLRPLFGKFDNKEISFLSKNKISNKNFLYIGNLLLEKEESRFICESEIDIIDSNQIKKDRVYVQKKILNFCNNFDFIHVTFDIDVFKKDIISATGTPNLHGFDYDMVQLCLQSIKDSRIFFSLDLVEVNPHKKNAKIAIKIAQDIIVKLIS